MSISALIYFTRNYIKALNDKPAPAPFAEVPQMRKVIGQEVKIMKISRINQEYVVDVSGTEVTYVFKGSKEEIETQIRKQIRMLSAVFKRGVKTNILNYCAENALILYNALDELNNNPF